MAAAHSPPPARPRPTPLTPPTPPNHELSVHCMYTNLEAAKASARLAHLRVAVDALGQRYDAWMRLQSVPPSARTRAEAACERDCRELIHRSRGLVDCAARELERHAHDWIQCAGAEALPLPDGQARQELVAEWERRIVELQRKRCAPPPTNGGGGRRKKPREQDAGP